MRKRFMRGTAFALLVCLLLAAFPAVALAGTVTAVEEHCYIRESPGLSGEIIYTVPVGGTATYLHDMWTDNRGVTWYYAAYGDVIGWMSGLQVSVDLNDYSYDYDYDYAPDYDYDYDRVTAVQEHCYIRNAPGLSGKILYTVPVGDSAAYLYETRVDNRGVTWYKATYAGVTGWMSGLQVSLNYSGYDYALHDYYDNGVVEAVEEHCYIRSAPGLSGEILYTVPVGASATFLYDTEVDNRGVTWYKATYAGITGWMSGLQVEVYY